MAKDVCDALELEAARNSLSLLDMDERTTAHAVCSCNNFIGLRKDTVLVNDDKKCLHNLEKLGGNQRISTVSESSLYSRAVRKTVGYLKADPAMDMSEGFGHSNLS